MERRRERRRRRVPSRRPVADDERLHGRRHRRHREAVALPEVGSFARAERHEAGKRCVHLHCVVGVQRDSERQRKLGEATHAASLIAAAHVH